MNRNFWNDIPIMTRLMIGIMAGLVAALILMIFLRLQVLPFISSLPSFTYMWESLRMGRYNAPTPFPGAPSAILKVDTPVYLAPGEDNEIGGWLKSGQPVELVSVTPDQNWWEIRPPPGETGQAWIMASSISVLNRNGLPGLPTPTLPGPWLIAQVNAEIFAGPGRSYGTVGLLLKGETGQVVGRSENGSWWVIRMPYTEGGQGWVAVDQVLAQNTENLPVIPAPDASPAVATAGEPATVRAVTDVNIRAGPATQYEKIGVLRNGQTANILGVSPDGFWWLIAISDASGGQGWVSVDYVVANNAEQVPIFDPQAAAKARIPPTPAAGAPSIVAKVNVNIRAGPSREFAVLGSLDQGQIAEVIGVSEDGLWWVIKMPSANNGQGWVAAAYVTASNAQGVPIIK